MQESQAICKRAKYCSVIDPITSGLLLSGQQFSNFAKPSSNWFKKKSRSVTVRITKCTVSANARCLSPHTLNFNTWHWYQFVAKKMLIILPLQMNSDIINLPSLGGTEVS